MDSFQYYETTHDFLPELGFDSVINSFCNSSHKWFECRKEEFLNFTFKSAYTSTDLSSADQSHKEKEKKPTWGSESA